MFTAPFEIFSPANDSGRDRQVSWTLLIDRTNASVHLEGNWQDGRPAPHHEGMRIVTLAEFLRRELSENLKSRSVDALRAARIPANDP